MLDSAKLHGRLDEMNLTDILRRSMRSSTWRWRGRRPNKKNKTTSCLSIFSQIYCPRKTLILFIQCSASLIFAHLSHALNLIDQGRHASFPEGPRIAGR
ncbi:unnamed protein product [Amoebophrya sp. A25]|nr:unnamed protein product [Amoebophrya sp. A25]|eukprot:GSA25T00022159001.1